MKYDVIYERSIASTYTAISALTVKVNRAIEEGWKPIGGIAVYDTYACQAMIKDNNDETLKKYV